MKTNFSLSECALSRTQQGEGARARTSVPTVLRPRMGALQCQGGSAVIVVFVLMGLMVSLLVANNKTLTVLNSNLQLIERKQVKLLSAPPVTTNSAALKILK